MTEVSSSALYFSILLLDWLLLSIVISLYFTQRTAMTEGVNLRGCWTFGYGIVDLDRFTTNEIGDTLKTYGVEAARTSIIQEMGGIFGAYGIGVDPRHLTVISDYMVCLTHFFSLALHRSIVAQCCRC